MKVSFEIFLADKGKKAAEKMADIAAKVVRSGIGSCVLVDVKNRVLAVQADAGRKGADDIGKRIADLIGTTETFAPVESRRMVVTV